MMTLPACQGKNNTPGIKRLPPATLRKACLA